MAQQAPTLKGVTRLSADLLEDYGQGAEASEGGLEQVEADECGEPQPVDTDIVCQPEGDQNGDTCEGENDAFDIHDGSPLVYVHLGGDIYGSTNINAL